MGSGIDHAEWTYSQVPFDVRNHVVRRGCRERQDRRRSKCAQPRERIEIRRSKIMSPLTDAVRLVDDDEIDRITSEQLPQVRGRQLLGGGEHELDRPAPDPGPCASNVSRGNGAIDLHGLQAELRQFLELIAHQRDQRRHNHRHARHQHGGHLVAQRLACAGGHDGERVTSGKDRVDHRLLSRTQLLEAEHLTHDL